MKIITEENYKDLQFDWYGMLVAIPKIELKWNAEFYIYGMQYTAHKKRYTYAAYDMEDGCGNGLSMNILNGGFDEIWKNFKEFDWYLFDNMLEFCQWYIDKDKQFKEEVKQYKEKMNSLYETIGTPTSQIVKEVFDTNREQPKIKRKELYKDIIEYIKIYVEGAFIFRDPNSSLMDFRVINKKIDEWLEEEV